MPNIRICLIIQKAARATPVIGKVKLPPSRRFLRTVGIARFLLQAEALLRAFCIAPDTALQHLMGGVVIIRFFLLF